MSHVGLCSWLVDSVLLKRSEREQDEARTKAAKDAASSYDETTEDEAGDAGDTIVPAPIAPPAEEGQDEVPSSQQSTDNAAGK